MTEKEKIELLADMFEVEADQIRPEAKLDSLIWDSIKRLTFIALIDEHFERSIRGPELKEVNTIQDLLSMMK